MPGLLLAAALAATAPGAVVARVDGEAITWEQVAARAQDAGVPPLAALEAEIREALLAQAARAEGLPERPEVKAALAAERRRLAVERLLEAEVYRGVHLTRAGLVQVLHARDDQVRISMVVRATLEEALLSLERLRRGESLIEEARGSPDPIVQSKSGVLGWVARENLAPAVAEAAFSAPLDTPTGPIPVSKGYTIVVVHERELADEVKLNEADPELRARAEAAARRAAVERYVARLRARTPRLDRAALDPGAGAGAPPAQAALDRALLEREALARGHDRGADDPQLRLNERTILARAMARRAAEAAGPPTELEIEARYREQLGALSGGGARPFGEVRGAIAEQLRRERAQAAVEALMGRLRREAHVVLDESALPPPPRR